MRNPRFDAAFKIIFGEVGAERRTMGFLNAIPGLTDKDQIEGIEILDPGIVALDQNDRTVFVNVLVRARCTTMSGRIFVIEMQKEPFPRHSNRWIYYSARHLIQFGASMHRKIKEEKKADQHLPKKPSYDLYRRLEPVKVVTVLDFEPTADPLQNARDIVVHGDIKERTTNALASELLSWRERGCLLPRR
jgi:hypothetical protein